MANSGSAHRQRLRERLLTSGAQRLTEPEPTQTGSFSRRDVGLATLEVPDEVRTALVGVGITTLDQLGSTTEEERAIISRSTGISMAFLESLVEEQREHIDPKHEQGRRASRFAVTGAVRMRGDGADYMPVGDDPITDVGAIGGAAAVTRSCGAHADISVLDLSTRAYNRLRRANLNTVVDLLTQPVERIAGLRGLGTKSYSELIGALRKYADQLGPDWGDDITSGSLPIGVLGLLPRMEARLMLAGISTLGALAVTPPSELGDMLGPKEAYAVLVKAAAHEVVVRSGASERHEGLRVPEEASPAIETWAEPSLTSTAVRSHVHLSSLDLSCRAHNALLRAGIETLDQLVLMSPEEILAVRNIGAKTLADIEDVVERHGDLVQFAGEAEQPTCGKSPSVHDLDLPMRVRATLGKTHVVTIEDLAAFSQERLLTQLDMRWKDIRGIEAVLGQRGLALATERSQYPFAARELITLARRKKIPLDLIPVDRMALFTHAKSLLNSASVTTIGQLCEASQVALERRFPDKLDTVAEIRGRLSSYLSWLVEQESWDSEILQQGVSPIYRIELAETSLDHILDEFLGCLDTDRRQEIIRLRWGLDEAERKTLEEIGELIGVTRERVRQIERKATRQLHRPSSRRVAGLLLELLREILVQAGGLATTHYLAETLERTVDAVRVNTRNAVRFLCSIDSRVRPVQKDVWGLEGYPLHRVEEINEVMLSILKEESGLASRQEILAEFRTTELYRELQQHGTHRFPDACLRWNPGIEISVDGQCTFAKAATARLYSVIRALRTIGGPAHYSEIARRANELLTADKRVSTHAVHARMGRLPDIFVRCGHGIFGLAEWGLHQDQSVADAAYRVLREAGQPLHVERIIDRVLDTWQVERGSVYTAIQSDERFYPVGQGAYWLADGIGQGQGGQVIESVTFLGEVITRQHIMTALTHFDRRYPDTNDYDSWLEERAHKHALRHDGRLYPCKFILSLARGCDVTALSGGERTNSVFRRLGFEVIDKPQQTSAGG